MKKDIIDIAMILVVAGFFFGIIPTDFAGENHPTETTVATTTFTAIEPFEKLDLPEPLTPIKRIEPGEYEWPLELKRICSCESTGRPGNEPVHYDKDGSVLRGRVNQNDVGMCQINLTYHENTATSMGLDLFNPDENFAYALQLYRDQGSQPWSWSRSCWGQ